MSNSLRVGAALLWLMMAGAEAVNLAGVEIAPMIRVEGQERPWSLLGSAQVHRSFIPFYGLALHGPADSVNRGELSDGLSALQITLVWYASELPKAQVEEHFRKLFEQNADEQALKGMASRLDKFLALLPAAARGQRITFTYTPDGGTHVSVENGGEGHFAGIDFNRAFLSLWLGPNADPDVRQGLIAATTR